LHDSAFATGAAGVMKSVFSVRSFRYEDDVAPSQKARILAETISDAMNDTAFTLVGATAVCAGILLVSWLRRRKGTA
jgi:hypothetical protein